MIEENLTLRVLAVLTKEEGPCTFSKISIALGIDADVITEISSRLRQHSLAVRGVHENKLALTVTVEGTKALARAYAGRILETVTQKEPQ